MQACPSNTSSNHTTLPYFSKSSKSLRDVSEAKNKSLVLGKHFNACKNINEPLTGIQGLGTSYPSFENLLP